MQHRTRSKKLNLPKTSFTIFLALLFSYSAIAWELEYDDEGIKVFTKEMENSSFKAFRGEMYVETSLKQLVSNHLQVEAMTEWLQDCSASELIGQLSEQDFYIYQRTNAPWPVSDRDYVLKAHIEQSPEDHVVTMRFTAETEIDKKDEDCVQVTELTGFWRFTPQYQEGQLTDSIWIEYETHADPAGDLPAWLANSFVVDQPLGTLRKLRKRLSETPAELLELSFITEPKVHKASNR